MRNAVPNACREPEASCRIRGIPRQLTGNNDFSPVSASREKRSMQCQALSCNMAVDVYVLSDPLKSHKFSSFLP